MTHTFLNNEANPTPKIMDTRILTFSEYIYIIQYYFYFLGVSNEFIEHKTSLSLYL